MELFGFISVLILIVGVYSLEGNGVKDITQEYLEEKEPAKYQFNKRKYEPQLPQEKPKAIEKNKWLYPTDDFGKMENGVVDKGGVKRIENNITKE